MEQGVIDSAIDEWRRRLRAYVMMIDNLLKR
jgi:hypothetical protein